VGNDLWSLPVRAAGCVLSELRGFVVEAQDGPVGTVLDCGGDAGQAYLIVALDPALGPAKAMLPAGLLERVDARRAAVRIACSRSQLAGAPRLESDRLRDGAYRAELTMHYAACAAA
jgi:hypothetical protein